MAHGITPCLTPCLETAIYAVDCYPVSRGLLAPVLATAEFFPGASCPAPGECPSGPRKELAAVQSSSKVEGSVVKSAQESLELLPGGSILSGSNRWQGSHSTGRISSGAMTRSSGKGNGFDNAPMESFWGTLKQELVHHRRYKTRQEAIRDITEYLVILGC